MFFREVLQWKMIGKDGSEMAQRGRIKARRDIKIIIAILAFLSPLFHREV